ncbi:MAG: O-antigen ligase family protein [Parvibaculum sp.]|nr:O-antigen ligase family protein [Parvibaculum sp.]
MEYLISLAIISMFVSFKLNLGLVQLRPFDAIAIVIFLIVLRQGALLKRLQLGFLILVPYFLWHVTSAFTVSTDNGLREGLQIALVAVFAYSTASKLEDIDYTKIARLILIGLCIITAFSIIWHINNGQWTGWKRLNDPKATFTFLPLVLGLLVLFADPSERRRHFFMWAILAVIIFLSGERKALVIYGLLTITLFSGGRIVRALPIIAAGYALVAFLAATVTDPYLERQLRTFLEFGETYQSYEGIAQGVAPVSLSNAQRIFTLHVSGEMIASNPILGVGTNAYTDLVRDRFAYLPDYMLIGIHGEFLRILAENGIVGFMLYLPIWIFSLLRTIKVLRLFAHAGIITEDQIKILPVIPFLPCFFYTAFEASGTHSFVVLIFISLLPEALYYALSQHGRKLKRRATTNPSEIALNGPDALPGDLI